MRTKNFTIGDPNGFIILADAVNLFRKEDMLNKFASRVNLRTMSHLRPCARELSVFKNDWIIIDFGEPGNIHMAGLRGIGIFNINLPSGLLVIGSYIPVTHESIYGVSRDTNVMMGKYSISLIDDTRILFHDEQGEGILYFNTI